MSDRDTEHWLRSVPTKNLTPDADQRILDAILTADTRRNRSWWTTRIPLWQAAAACLLIFFITLAIARSHIPQAPVQPKPTAQHPALAETQTPNPPQYRTDISKWKILMIQDQGTKQ